MPVNQVTPRQVGVIVVPCKNPGHVSFLVDHHIQNKISPDQLSHPDAVFMKGVSLQNAIGHLGVIDHFVGVHELHRLKTRDPRQDGFPATGVTCIEVGFDQTG